MDQILKEKEPPTNHYEFVLNNALEPDVEIVIENEIIKSHKLVLGKENPTFMELFASQPKQNRFHIFELDPAAFKIFINYLYVGSVYVENVNENLLLVARRFSDLALINFCTEKLIETLTKKNATQRLLKFVQFQEKQLIAETSNFVAKNFNDIKTRPEFKHILDQPTILNAIFDVFDTCKVTVLTESINPTRQTLIDCAIKSDVTFNIEDYYFLAHKGELSGWTVSFGEELNASLSRSKLPITINYPNLDPEAFKHFLLFRYRSEIDWKALDENTSRELVKMSHCYSYEQLKQSGDNYLAKMVDPLNAIKLLLLGSDFDLPKLTAKAAGCIVDHFSNMSLNAGFQEFKQNPKAVDAVLKNFYSAVNRLRDLLSIQSSTESYVGTFELAVPCVDGVNYSVEFYVKGSPWKIGAALKSDDLSSLFISLHCLENSWFSYEVNYSLALISNVNELHDVTVTGTYLFSSEGYSIYDNYVSWTDLTDKKRALLEDGKITVKVTVTVVNARIPTRNP